MARSNSSSLRKEPDPAEKKTLPLATSQVFTSVSDPCLAPRCLFHSPLLWGLRHLSQPAAGLLQLCQGVGRGQGRHRGVLGKRVGTAPPQVVPPCSLRWGPTARFQGVGLFCALGTEHGIKGRESRRKGIGLEKLENVTSREISLFCLQKGEKNNYHNTNRRHCQKHGIFVVCSGQPLILRWQKQTVLSHQYLADCKNSHPHNASWRLPQPWCPVVAAVFTYGAWACSAAQSPASTARRPATCLLPPPAAAGTRLLPWWAGPGPPPSLCRCAWAGYCLCCRCGDPRPHPPRALHL